MERNLEKVLLVISNPISISKYISLILPHEKTRLVSLQKRGTLYDMATPGDCGIEFCGLR